MSILIDIFICDKDEKISYINSEIKEVLSQKVEHPEKELVRFIKKYIDDRKSKNLRLDKYQKESKEEEEDSVTNPTEEDSDDGKKKPSEDSPLKLTRKSLYTNKSLALARNNSISSMGQDELNRKSSAPHNSAASYGAPPVAPVASAYGVPAYSAAASYGPGSASFGTSAYSAGNEPLEESNNLMGLREKASEDVSSWSLEEDGEKDTAVVDFNGKFQELIEGMRNLSDGFSDEKVTLSHELIQLSQDFTKTAK